MMKRIKIESSKYFIEYDPNKIWDYKVFRGNINNSSNSDENNVTNYVKSNVMNDIVFHIIENLENGNFIKGIYLISE